MNGLLLLLFVWFSFSVNASEAVLPSPLTLSAALAQAENPRHFELQIINHDLDELSALSSAQLAADDVTVNLEGRISKVGVSDLGDPDDDNDSAVSLFLRKPLYDFGSSDQSEHLIKLQIGTKLLGKKLLIQQRKLRILEKYYAVLNADNEFLRHNESLAIGFIRFDRARENTELGLSSELEVLRLQSLYEVIRQQRYNAENQQRLTRTILSEELGFPQQPVDELEVPKIQLDRPIIDDVDELIEQAFKNSIALKITQNKIASALQSIAVADSKDSAKLDLELEVSDYVRGSSRRDDWRATIYFDFPLYSGNRSDSSVQRARAIHARTIGQFEQEKSRLRLEVLELWQNIRQQTLVVQGALIDLDYRDLNLDKSRAEYELEFQTDLGDSMVNFSNSRANRFQAEYALSLVWYKLEALVGKSYLDKMSTELSAQNLEKQQ